MNVWHKPALAAAAALLAAGCAALPSLPGSGAPAPLPLLDGSGLEGWKQVGPGRFTALPDGSIVSEGGMGLLYYAERPFRDFVLELDWLAESPGANSGIFVRFPDAPADPWDAVRGGYEVQIDGAAGPAHSTGAIYDFAAPARAAARPAGEWNHYRIEVTGQRYQVYLNGHKVNDFIGDRGRQGYIGLQNHDADSRVRFRNVRVTPLRPASAPERLGDLFTVTEQRAPVRVLMLTATHGWRHADAIRAAREVMDELDRATELEVEATEDVGVLTADNLAKYDVLLLANATLRATPPDSTRGDAPADRETSGWVGTYTPVTQEQAEALLGFVRGGGGLVAAHSALDALYSVEGYREMLGGGLFEKHPWTQQVRVDVEDPSSPAVAHLGNSFWLRDEIYVLDRNPRWNSHVLLSLNMPSVGVETGPPTGDANDHPLSWIRPFGEGRVFVTALGHFPDVWKSPAYARHLLEGVRLAAGRTPADIAGHRRKETISPDVWPDDLVTDERGNVWIAELTGKIHRYDAETKETSLIAEIPTTNPVNIEHGVYGVEIDPNFYRGEPYLYIYYAERETFINTLSRFTYRDGKLDMDSERVILRVPTEPACCHQAGDLEWGPNQTLFVSTGDTGQSGTKPEDEISQERIAAFVERNELRGYHWSRITDAERTAQNLQELRGKILRINKDGTIPRDNPFYGKPGVRWEIYAYGLRNPYRMKYDEQTGRLFIGVVGPDEQTTYDEYNVATRGGENFGWPRDNGLLFYNEWTPEMIPGWTPPLWEYTYATGSRSATMGPIYRSTGKHAFPERFQGRAFVYDWSRRWLKYGDVVNGTFASDTTASMRSDGRQVVVPAKRLINLKTFDVLEATSPISMDVGPDGCLYLAEFAGFWGPGSGSNVSRYCWVREAPPAAAAEPEGDGEPGSR